MAPPRDTSQSNRNGAVGGRSLERILNGTMIALARRGANELSMTDVCEAAGVSRATLYRYFSRKQDLLTAVGEYVSQNFIAGIREAIARSDGSKQRLRLVLEFIIRYTATVKTDRMLELEPGFVLKFLQTHFVQHIAVFNEALAPVYDDVEACLGIRLNRLLTSEVLLRAQESTAVLPAGRSWEGLPDALSRLLDQLRRPVSR